MEKKRSVGLVIVTEVPGRGKVAVLQIRGEINPQKLRDGIDETWPGGCQVTAHGRVKEGESDLDALWREIKEELPGLAGSHLLPIQNLEELKPFLTRESETEVVVTYAVELPCEFLQLIRLGPASGGLRLVTADEARNINELHQTDRVHGVPTRIFQMSAPFACIGKLTAMFPDEREAVQKALGVTPP